MNRNLLVVILVGTALFAVAAQDRPLSLPPGPAPGPTDQSWLAKMLLVQANMIEGGEVLFLIPVDSTEPNKAPAPPALFAKVDGKTVKAFGTDRKKLDIAELNRRLSLRAAAVVVYGQPPDPFFLKALNERTVVFVVSKKMFDQMAKAVVEESLQGWWTVMNSTNAGEEPSQDVWVFSESKIQLRRNDQAEGLMSYKIDTQTEPRTIDLIPEHGPARGKTLKRIYELDGNSLKICHTSAEIKEPEKADRPREIGEKNTVTLTFRRMLP